MPVLMWKCEVCGEESDYNHDACSSCETPRPPGIELPAASGSGEETYGKHLRRTTGGLLIFYPRGFEAQGLAVRDPVLEAKLIARLKLARVARFVSLLLVTIAASTSLLVSKYGLFNVSIGFLVYFLIRILIERWWKSHLERLAEGLMPWGHGGGAPAGPTARIARNDQHML